jgi:integrase
MEKFLRAYSSPYTKQSYQSALSLYFNTLNPTEEELSQKEKYARALVLSEKYLDEKRDFRDDVNAFRDILDNKTPKINPANKSTSYSQRSRNCYIAVVFKFLGFNKIIISSDDKRMTYGKKIKRKHSGSEIPTSEQLVQICKYLLIQARTLILTLKSSGMRIGEAT